MYTYNIGINGFGRMGRAFYRALTARSAANLRVVMVNDCAKGVSAEAVARSLRQDTTRGALHKKHIAARSDRVYVDEDSFVVTSVTDPCDVPWEQYGVDLVIETTGRFSDGTIAGQHNARHVLISAPAHNVDATLVMGVNDHTYNPKKHRVISGASCGVNAMSVLMTALWQHYGTLCTPIAINCILSGSSLQRVQDGFVPYNDHRLGRSYHNIVPHNYGAARTLCEVLQTVGTPKNPIYLDGPVQDNNVRVPTQAGQQVCIWVGLNQPTTAEDVNHAILAASAGQLKDLLRYPTHPEDGIVSSDVIGNTASCLFDPRGTRVDDNRVMVTCWLDNEIGYANRLVDLATLIAQRDPQATAPHTARPQKLNRPTIKRQSARI